MTGRPYLTHGSGYLLNDNRAAGGVKEEQDVGICPHCQKVIRLQQWQVAGTNQRGWCMRCMAPCCGTGPCAEEFMRAGCLPFVKKIDMPRLSFDAWRGWNRSRLLRSFGRV
jgi:hypothetical protein